MNIEDYIQQKLRDLFDDDKITFDKSRFAGGLTNDNYVMEIQGLQYVIRQPGGMTNVMIDRAMEKENNQIVSELGLTSECIYFDEVSGVKITVYIENSKNIACSDPNSKENVQAVSSLLKKIHGSNKEFPNRFDWKKELEKYELLVKELNGEFFHDYFEKKQKLYEFADGKIGEMVLVPCHNDTVPENFIKDDQGRVYLIDWEYSGMNHPCWDLAAYILESRLESDAIEQLLKDYYGRVPAPQEMAKIKSFMLIQDLLWTVWALIRHYNGDDFLDYCYFRYERFRKNIREMTSSQDYPLSAIVKS